MAVTPLKSGTFIIGYFVFNISTACQMKLIIIVTVIHSSKTQACLLAFLLMSGSQ